MRYFVLTIILLIFCKPGAAQLPGMLQVTRYNETNGISDGRVTTMLQGDNGYLWLGTTNGLLCFDSYTFRQYSDPAITNSITRLAEDSNHVLWMSLLGGGLASFDPATGIFSGYKIENAKDPSLASSEVTLLFFDSKGQLWIGTAQKGLIKADVKKNSYTVYNIVDEKSTFYVPALRKVYNSVYDACEDKKGGLWLATHDGLYHFNPLTEEMKAVREKPLQKNMRRLDLFRSMQQDNDTLWLGAWAGGLSAYNKKTGEWKTWLPDPGRIQSPLYNVITRIISKNKNELWLCSPDKGLGIFNKTTKQFYFFNNDKNSPGLPDSQWEEIITDKDENVWGRGNDGLLKIEVPPCKFTFNTLAVTKSTGHIYYTTAMWENDRMRFTGTSFADGLHILNKRNGKETILAVAILPSEEQSMDIRHVMKDSRHTIWVLSRDFIYQYDTAKEMLVKIIQPPAYSSDNLTNNFSHATEDKEGNIWFTTKRNGVFVYNPLQKAYTHYNDKTDSAHFINATYLLDGATDARGRVWLAGPYGFLGFADAVTKRIVQLHTGEGDALKIPGTKTFSLFADSKGNIWAGTFNGLCYFDCQGATPSLKKIFHATDGLRSNLVTDILEDGNRNIWCVTEAAVCMIRHDDYRITTYGALDGIIKGGLDLKLVNAPGNSLRLLTSYGYYDFDNTDLDDRKKTAPLVVTRLMVNDKEFYYKDILQKQAKIDLAPSQNTFSFEFAAIDFKRPDKQQYSYRLEGFDKEWIDAGNRRFVSYTNIPGGHYTFKVKSGDRKSYTNDPVVSIPLFIGTPFNKTFIFYCLIVMLVLGSLFWLYSNRMAHQQEVHELQSKAQLLEKEKTLVMYEGLKQHLNPHFLFNSLTSLSGLIQSDQKMAGDFLEQMSGIYRYILKNRDSETVFLSEEIKFVTYYIQLQQTRFKKGLEVNVKIDGDYYHRKIAPVTLQNLVENAMKHNIIDIESPLVIELYCEDEYLVVQNNLQKKGFVETSNRQGLANMQSLYKYLTSRIIIINEDQNKFSVKIPLL